MGINIYDRRGGYQPDDTGECDLTPPNSKKYDFDNRKKQLAKVPKLPRLEMYSDFDSRVNKFTILRPDQLELDTIMFKGILRFDNDDLLKLGKWIVENLDD